MELTVKEAVDLMFTRDARDRRIEQFNKAILSDTNNKKDTRANNTSYNSIQL